MIRRGAAIAGLLAVLAACAFVAGRRPARQATSAPSHTAVSPSPRAPDVRRREEAPIPAQATSRAPEPESPRDPRARHKNALARYLESARYPPSCRPMRERPDLAEPHRVAPRTLPLASRADRSPGRARVTLWQDRHRTTAGDAVTLGIACSLDGDDVPCDVRSAWAGPAPDMAAPGAPTEPRPVTFATVRGGAVEARFDPSRDGFDAYHGPIRVTARVRAGGEEGEASFDVEHTPSPPAAFTGEVREALSDGSIEVRVGVAVERAGRYVIVARVEDAGGTTFAFLRESATLGAGRSEVALRIFGKLVADEGAAAPFRVRDLEGVRLVERYPDKETMRPIDGVVLVTRQYAAADFSTAPWDSDDKTRRVRLLERDLL